MNSSTRLLVVTLVVALVLLPSQVHAFGAGSTAFRPQVKVLKLTRDRHCLNLCPGGQELAPWRYRRYSEDCGLHQGSQMDIHDDQAGLLWVR
jgi:hypothetical protein